MFEKKYSPVVLTKMSLMAQEVTRKVIGYILGKEIGLDDFVGMTIEATRGKEDTEYYLEVSSEVIADERLAKIDVNVAFRKSAGDWECVSNRALAVFPMPGLSRTRLWIDMSHNTKWSHEGHDEARERIPRYDDPAGKFLQIRKRLLEG